MRKVVIELLIDSDDPSEIADCVSETLSPALARYAGRSNNPLIDWQYVNPEPISTDGLEFPEYAAEIAPGVGVRR